MSGIRSAIAYKADTRHSEELQSRIDELEARLGTAETEAAKVKDLEAKLEAAQKSSSGDGSATSAGPAGPLVSSTEGKNWKGDVKFQGGPQTYAMASDAFKMALECKDRGDNRMFSMIFDQIFMEMRRTVGVGKDEKDGYKSKKLIEQIFEKSKDLNDRGDKRPFGLIFAGVSMQFRRDHIAW